MVAESTRARALGTGHSFSRIADTTGDLISTAALPPVADIDAATGTVIVAAGVRYGDLASKDSMTKAEAAAKQAIQLNDNLAEAHNAYASVLMKGHWDWDNAEKEFKRAIAIEPDYSPAHWGYSALLAHTGRIGEALAESQRARELDQSFIKRIVR